MCHQKRRNWNTLVVLLVSALLLFCSPVSAEVDYETLKKEVVKISTPNEAGAGIIVGIESGTILIATALHVIADAKTIQVDFRGRQQKFPGKRFEKHNETLDLAVVIVDSPSAKSILQNLPNFSLGNVESLQLGAEVSAIGHPVGNDWQVAVLANRIQALRDPDDSRLFRFTNLSIDRGNSGGPVFDSRGTLIGMVTRVVPPGHTVAVKIAEVVNLLNDWGINSNQLKINDKSVPHPRTNSPTVTPRQGYDRKGQKEWEDWFFGRKGK